MYVALQEKFAFELEEYTAASSTHSVLAKWIPQIQTVAFMHMIRSHLQYNLTHVLNDYHVSVLGIEVEHCHL